MENVFTWYPQPHEFGAFALVVLTIVTFATLFYVSRKQKPEEEGYEN
jgi:hypothetical protein